jgi:NADPH-dependent 2,4-dienoyl-CoA reductase/sulfur reductase-like enzyme
MKVCVIGAGKAGVEAAREAVRGGADVTLVDAREGPLPDWQSWPDLIHQNGAGAPRQAGAASCGAECAFGARVVSLARGEATTASGSKFTAGAFVLAVGSGFERVPFEGRSKPGVTVMDSPERYAGLRQAWASSERVAVAGEGTRAMEIADRVAYGGRRVTVLLSTWQHAAPGALAAQVLQDAAMERGVSLVCGRVDRALGPSRLEAITSAGQVLPCDALAVAPRRTPNHIPGQAAVGRHGGVRTRLDMRSGVPGILSAGGCAELEEGNPSPCTLEDEQGTSGRIAGANAAGAGVRMPACRRASCSVFGLVWTRVGMGASAARAAGLDVGEVVERRDERSSCTITYDRASGVAVGLEVVSEQGSREQAAAPLDGPATLRSLAYGGTLGSSDISMVSETARLGLELWSRS